MIPPNKFFWSTNPDIWASSSAIQYNQQQDQVIRVQNMCVSYIWLTVNDQQTSELFNLVSTKFCYLHGYFKKFQMPNLSISNTMSSTQNYRQPVSKSDDLPTQDFFCHDMTSKEPCDFPRVIVGLKKIGHNSKKRQKINFDRVSIMSSQEDEES